MSKLKLEDLKKKLEEGSTSLGSKKPIVDELLAKKLNAKQDKFKKSKGRMGTIAPSDQFVNPDVLPTGIPELDNDILAIGGIALGRVIEIAGETSAGKSTLSMNIAREAINAGLTVVIAENEGTFTEEYAEKIGMPPGSYHVYKGYEDKVKNDKKVRLYLTGPEFLEGIFRLVELEYDLIIVDSLFGIEDTIASEARLINAKMNTKQSGAGLIARFAKLCVNGWEPLLAENKGKKVVRLTDSGVTMITINHLKPNRSGYGMGTVGSLDMPFLYTQRIWLEKIGMSFDDLDEKGNPIYTKVRVRCEKTKLSPGGRYAEMYIDNRDGRFVTSGKVVVASARKKGLLLPADKDKKSAWLHYSSQFEVDVNGLEKDVTEENIMKDLEIGMKWHGAQKFIQFCEERLPLYNYILRFTNVQRTRKI